MPGPTEVVIGVDVGTTDTKAIVVSREGRVLGAGRRATGWDTSRGDGGAQILPERLLDGVVLACLEALEDAGGRQDAEMRAVGLGVTGMAESGVLMTARGVPAFPVIAWFDPRGAEQIESLGEAFGADFPARTGLPLTPLATFSKLLWMTGGCRISLDGAHWLNVPEYVVHALGGQLTCEPSLSSRTGLLDQDTLGPYEPALEILGASPSLLPPIQWAGTPLGKVPAGGPAALRGAVLTVAGHDHPVASIAAGATGPDDLFDSCGTAEAVIRVTERNLAPSARIELTRGHLTQGAHVVRGRRVLLGGTKAGLLLRRVLAMLGADDPAAVSALDEDCPLGDVNLPVRVSGGRMDDTSIHVEVDSDEVAPRLVWRAALDAVGAQAAQLVETGEQSVGPAKHMVAAGGWTRLASYREIKRRTFPGMTFSDIEQPGALGAAGIAAAAVDEHPLDDLHRFVGAFAGAHRRA